MKQELKQKTWSLRKEIYYFNIFFVRMDILQVYFSCTVTVPHPDVFWAYLFFEAKDWIV